VEVWENQDGWMLMTDGEPFMVNDMNWDYYPIDTNYEYSIWEESTELIRDALTYEMGHLQNIGVNAIHVYTGIPREWIEYIHDNFGIYTMLNHSFGRYGLELDGEWVGNTEYSDPRVIELLLDEYKGTRGLLLYLLGNENNYGLFWDGPFYPRAAYYAIIEAHRFDPYAPDASLETLEDFFSAISLDDAYERAKNIPNPDS
jgi:hypothetical protein